MLAGLVLCVVVFPPCFRFAEPFIMGRVLLLALASFTPSVDAGLPYNWYLSRGLLLRGCDAESTRPAALRSGTPFYLLVLPDVSSDAADCEATESAVKSSSTSFLGAADVQRARQSSGARLSVPLLSQYVPCGPSVDAVMQIASYKAILVQCSVMRSPLCFVRPLVHAAACVRQNSLMWNDSPCLMSTV